MSHPKDTSAGGGLEAGQLYCDKCGSPVTPMMFSFRCLNCGNSGSVAELRDKLAKSGATLATAKKTPVVIVGPHGKKLGKPVLEAITRSLDFSATAGVVSSRDPNLAPYFGCAMHRTFDDVVQNTFVGDLLGDRDHPVSAVVFYAVKGPDLYPCFRSAVEAGFRRHVIGSTGIPPESDLYFREAADSGQIIFRTSNFSEEATLADWLAEQVSRALPNHDAGVFDIHHNQKADVPSGTSNMFAESIARGRGLGTDAVRLGCPESGAENRGPEHICVSALRLGGVPGEHQVVFAGPYATLTITQRAYSSEGFAVAALRAIRFAAAQTAPGLYGMRDVMGLR